MAHEVEMKIPPCFDGTLAQSSLSGLAEYIQGWFSGIYYWIYPGMTAAAIVWGLIKLVMPE
ncbi:MAG: hypothetical protein ABSG91_24285 [Syntrophobacteraceae bacterium]|jgi:hypothetical protein